MAKNNIYFSSGDNCAYENKVCHIKNFTCFWNNLLLTEIPYKIYKEYRKDNIATFLMIEGITNNLVYPLRLYENKAYKNFIFWTTPIPDILVFNRHQRNDPLYVFPKGVRSDNNFMTKEDAEKVVNLFCTNASTERQFKNNGYNSNVNIKTDHKGNPRKTYSKNDVNKTFYEKFREFSFTKKMLYTSCALILFLAVLGL